MKFSFKKRCKAPSSFRVSSIMGRYDLTSSDVVETFSGEIPIDLQGDWNIGIIYGNSGTGKTQIVKNIFGEEAVRSLEYSASSVLDDFSTFLSSEEIVRVFNSVGFTTAKSWLKPYHVLSNGEKMRVDMARSILEGNELTIFDEFTSVIDRKVAKVGSFALQKAIRKANTKFIAVSCHEDIIDWLEPDWVFCTNDMTFHLTREVHRRPELKIEIYEVKGTWEIFKKYHYMNENLLEGSHQYVAFCENSPIAFCAMTNLVHDKIRNGMRLHRLVVLPDYQGIGIGSILLNEVSQIWKSAKYRIFARLSHPALVNSLSKDSKWRLSYNVGRAASHEGSMAGTGSSRRLTTGWEFVG